MKRLIFIAILLASCRAHAASPRDAVGKLDSGCSAVIISPDGLVLSSEHCGISETATLELRGETLRLVRIHAPEQNNTDEAVLLKIVHDGSRKFAYYPVAKSPPQPGEHVESYGFPAGNWSVSAGTVVRVSAAFKTSAYLPSYAVEVDYPSVGGASGGPLVNEQREVIGLLSTTGGGRSQFVGVQSAHQALAQQRLPHSRNRGEIVVFLSDGSWSCQPCDQYKREVMPQLKAKYGENRVRVVTVDSRGKWSDADVVAEYRAATGYRGNIPAPTTWVRGTTYQRAGCGGIFGFIAGIFRALGILLFGEPEPAPPPPSPEGGISPFGPDEGPDLGESEPVPEPIPEPEPEPDWSHIKIVVLAAQQEAKLNETARDYLLHIGIGRLERWVSDLSGGKAALSVVTERLSPERYRATSEALGHAPEKFLVAALVKEQPLGLVKGLVAKKIEAELPDKLKGMPVEVITERSNSATFTAIEQALLITDGEKYERGDGSLIDDAKDAAKGVVLGKAEEAFNAKFADKEDVIAFKDQVVAAVEKTERGNKSLVQWLIAIAMTVAAGMGVGMLKDAWEAKQLKKAIVATAGVGVPVAAVQPAPAPAPVVQAAPVVQQAAAAVPEPVEAPVPAEAKA